MTRKTTATNRDVLRWFWVFAGKYRWFFAISAVCFIFAGIADNFTPILLKKLVDGLSGPPNASTVHALVLTLATIVGLSLINQVLFRFGNIFNIVYEPRVMSDSSAITFKYLLKHSYQYFADAFSGSLVRRITRSAGAYEELVDQLYYNLIPLVVNVIVALTAIAFRSSLIALIAGAWLALTLTFNILFVRRIQRIDIARAEADSEVTATMTDAVTNSVNIKLFNGYPHEEKRVNDVITRWRKLMVRGWAYSEIGFTVQSILFVLVEGGVMYAAIQLWAQGKLTAGDFIMFQGFLTSLIVKMWNMTRVIRRLFSAFSDAKEQVDMLDLPHGIQDVKGAKPLAIKRGEIAFDHLGFSYQQTREVLHDFSLTIKPGERVALVGPSGAGKSTIVKMLFRFFDPVKGTITIDGQDIARVTQESLRQALSLVPQDPSLFHRSLLDNIRYGRRNATEKEAIRAAKLAHCDEFINNLPDGYQTFVGERGIKLSGGERQRVAIARAILKNAPILVLDEATSSLDSESEALIQDALKTLMAGKTTLVIAHRLSTIMNMDRIVVMEQGKIIEIGNHETLLAKPTLYQKLWEIQAGGFGA